MDIEKVRSFFAGDRFAQKAGIEIIDAQPGYSKCRMEITNDHLNAANVVQGGAIFTLADLAFAVASNSRGQLALGISANISFITGRSTGYLYAEAFELSEPKKLGNYEVKIIDEEGTLIALFNGVAYRKNQQVSFE